MKLSDCDQIYRSALQTVTATEFVAACEPLMGPYKILSVELGRGNIFWRARIIEQDRYKHIDELDYPPAEICGNGRLNKKGSPWFYISASIETALKEVGATQGQLVQVAGYRVLVDQFFHLIVIGEYSSVQKKGYTQLNGTDPGNTIHKLLEGHKEKAQVVVSIDRFFSSVLSDPQASDTEYVKTQALAKLLLSRVPADGIAFPSVKDPGGMNFGVGAEASDRLFHNVACVVAKVGNSYMQDMLEYEITCGASGLTDGNEFMWPNEPRTGTYTLYNMTKEEYEHAKAHDPDGKNMQSTLSFYTPDKARHA